MWGFFLLSVIMPPSALHRLGKSVLLCLPQLFNRFYNDQKLHVFVVCDSILSTFSPMDCNVSHSQCQLTSGTHLDILQHFTMFNFMCICSSIFFNICILMIKLHWHLCKGVKHITHFFFHWMQCSVGSWWLVRRV